jgi:thiamine transporter
MQNSDSGLKVFPNVKVLAEASAMIALAAALYFIKIYQLPQGGSVTAGSMVPILYLSLRRGPAIGSIAGTAFGLIQYLIEPFFFHPVQFILDYPLAIGVLGIAGLFPRHPYTGVTLALGVRFLCHFTSGIVFFASSAPEGMNPAIYSMWYQATYLLPELAVSLVVMYLLRKKIDYAA